MGNVIFILIAVVILAADQATKLWFSSILSTGQTFWHWGFISVTLATNTGAAFSLFQDAFLPLVIIRFVGIILVLTIVIFFNHRIRAWGGNWIMAALGLILAGAAGNLIDQLRLHYVVDFLYTDFWPTFNIADSSVVVAMFILIFLLILPRKHRSS
jgi:signal peptidase II